MKRASPVTRDVLTRRARSPLSTHGRDGCGGGHLVGALRVHPTVQRCPSGRPVSGFVQVAQNLPRTGRVALLERDHEQQRFASGQGFVTGSKCATSACRQTATTAQLRRSDSSIRRSVGVNWAPPHWVKAASEQVRVTLMTGFSILADTILPFEMSTVSVTSNVSWPTEAANPAAVFRTWTQLFGASATRACIQSNFRNGWRHVLDE